MVLSGQYTINYTLKGENKRICVKINIKPKKRLIDIESEQLLWEVSGTINGLDIDQSELKGTVNAQLVAEEIAENRIEKLREEYGRSLRIKKNKKI
jgi:hypothetical protein